MSSEANISTGVTGSLAAIIERPLPETNEASVRVRYYDADDTVILDNRYLTKGIAGRILWLLLTVHETEGRATFLNRELRLHPFLKLSAYNPNLETRLIHLKRRLEELNAPIRLAREIRGQLRLDVQARTKLERIADFAA